jgi:hypothetical protein
VTPSTSASPSSPASGGALKHGVGTGRSGLPLVQRGVTMDGIDLEPAPGAQNGDDAQT